MNSAMLYYYNLKEILKTLPQNHIQSMDLSDDNIFNYATFSDLGSFYKRIFRIDKYKLDQKLKDEHFYDFLKETIYIFMKTASPNQLLLIYAMLAHYILEKDVNEYLSPRISKLDTFNLLSLKIDRYYSKIYDEIDLNKQSIYSIFPNAFKYTKEMNDLVAHPFVKIYSFFNTNNYFKRAMKNKKRHYKHHFKHLQMDLNVLNLDNEPYTVDDIEYNYSLNEIIANSRNKALEQIKIIDAYIFDKKDKEFNELFNIKE